MVNKKDGSWLWVCEREKGSPLNKVINNMAKLTASKTQTTVIIHRQSSLQDGKDSLSSV